MISLSPAECVEHLRPSTWAMVNRHLIGKALAEFSHELLLEPKLIGQDGSWGLYSLEVGASGVEYRFRASVLELDHWWIDEGSIQRYEGGREVPLDAEGLITDLRERLAIPASVLPEYLQEISCTLYAAAYKLATPALTASEIAHASFQKVESAMTEGHPIFVANNARVGFNARDYRAYAPEVAASVALRWLAARRERVQLGCIEGVSYEGLLQDELGGAALDAFKAKLTARGANPGEYVFIPVHPWQWVNRIQQMFAGDLARGELVYLGEGADQYQPQQSIRTLFNLTHPERCYVKTALSILNMGFTRGMPTAIAQSAVAVNDWVSRTVEQDPFLRESGFSLLREVSYVGYGHRHYERASKAKHEPYKEMLAALWRESPVPRLAPGERLMTMAALLHVDAAGGSVLGALIRASGLSVDDWIRAYLRAYLLPLLHCFYAHKLTFTPHCENVILVLSHDTPVRMFMKDIAEDVGVLNPETALPEKVRRLALSVPEEVMTLTLFTDVFDCVFRFIARILMEHMNYPESRFWLFVAECIGQYQASQRRFADRFARYDLFAPTFARNCLNRLQLRNNRLMVDLNAPEPVDSLQFAGTLRNPIARFAGGAHGRA